jgi:HD-GYP domain-containing protein (c-di-GMP phosphodiesterase class II)/GGDEF domain-containing protein
VRSLAHETLGSELFHGGVYGLGLSAAVWSLWLAGPELGLGAWGFIGLAAWAEVVRFRVGRLGRFSLGLPFTLATLVLYGLGPAVLAAALAGLLQGLVAPGSRRPVRVAAFGLGSSAIRAFLAGSIYLGLGGTTGALPWLGDAAALSGFAATSLATDSVLEVLAVATAHRLPPFRSPLLAVGRSVARILFGTAAGMAVIALALHDPSRFALLGLPLLCLIQLWCRERVERIGGPDRSRRSTVYRAVTRALTRAVAIQDQAAERHLWRVQQLSLAVAERMRLSNADLESLATASLVHEVGRLALADPALADGTRATRGSNVYVHPSVTVELLETLRYPRGVLQTVRHASERWDGTGRPAGLRGDEIPIGSRILAAVDRYDSLAQKRDAARGLCYDEARLELARQAHRRFDPEIVETLLEYLDRRVELDRPRHEASQLDTGTSRPADAAGVRLPQAQRSLDLLHRIGRATRQSLDRDERLTLAARPLAELVPYSTLAVYRIDAQRAELKPIFTLGVGERQLRRHPVEVVGPVAQWVDGQRQDAIVGAPGRGGPFAPNVAIDALRGVRSSVAVPLIVLRRVVGALVLHDSGNRCFSESERRHLTTAAGYIAQAIHEGCDDTPVAVAGLTDPVTGLPNARFLYLELIDRLGQRKSEGNGFGLLALRTPQLVELGTWGVRTAERALGQVARRLAAQCREGETLVRFGPELFVVLGAWGSADLIDRWRDLVDAVEGHPLDHVPEPVTLRLQVAHVCHPEDGHSIDSLLGELEDRLNLVGPRGRTLVPFRRANTA